MVAETPMALVGLACEKGDRARREIPVGRFARPSEIEAAALYLCSGGTGIVNGANLMADGGNTAR
jgi:NAD(P)-dependent dehydrogenase (short-subunit alcohol dehydrogenase family)